jgi:isochorismate synthase
MDTLFYRLPNTQEVVQQSGTFVELLTNREPIGFVVTDFLHQRCFEFQPAETAPITWYSDDNIPVVISPRDYQLEAQALLHGFEAMQVEKAVYSRVKMVPFSIEKSEQLFDELCARYPNAFCYLVVSQKIGTWIGASPELLLERHGLQIQTVALAATQHVQEMREWTTKEYKEHDFVALAISESLMRNACIEITKTVPYRYEAGPVVHLKTDFQALLTGPNTWQIAMDLHPTPAVCGTPRMNALDLIVSREMHQRELYTGIIGIHDQNESHLFVNLRCAKIIGNKAYLFVGGGYTIDSVPDLEWSETENKAMTIIQAMSAVEKR